MGDFVKLGLSCVIEDALHRAYPQITKPSDIQKNVIPVLLNAKSSKDHTNPHVVIQGRTGGGKTLAFLLPLMHRLLEQHTANDVDESGNQTSSLIDQKHDRASQRSSIGTAVLIVCPTRELVMQTEILVQTLCNKLKGKYHWIVPGSLTGTSNEASFAAHQGTSKGSSAAGGKRRKGEKDRLRKGMHIVIGTPGRILDHLKNTSTWAMQIRTSLQYLVLDEADRLLDSGFSAAIKEMMSLLYISSRVSIVFCSATVGLDACRNLLGSSTSRKCLLVTSRDAVAEESLQQQQQSISSVVDRPEQLSHHFICAPTRLRLAVLVGFLCEQFVKSDKIVLFSTCCDTVDYLYALFSIPLQDRKTASIKPFLSSVKVSRLHGNMKQADRMAVFQSFVSVSTASVDQESVESSTASTPSELSKISQKIKSLLICTDVAARGLNLCAVDCIVQYDVPCDLDDYVHRAGRSGRQSERGRSVLFVMPSEKDVVSILDAKLAGIAHEQNSADTKNFKVFRKIRWDPMVELVAKDIPDSAVAVIEQQETANSSSNSTTGLKQEEEGGDQIIENVSVRRKINHWLYSLQEAVKTLSQSLVLDALSKSASPSQLPLKKHPKSTNSTVEDGVKLHQLAVKAYMSFVRAYSTHPGSQKHIFHIKRLHLGHLAAAFLLAEPPKKMNQSRQQQSANSKQKSSKSTAHHEILLDKKLADELDLNLDGSSKKKKSRHF